MAGIGRNSALLSGIAVIKLRPPDGAMTSLSAAVERIELLSPAEVHCFMDCQVRWWYKYNLQYSYRSSGNQALERAVHATLLDNFEQKIDSHEDLPVLGVLALFRQAWAIECGQTEFREDEDPAALALCGQNLVRKYIDEVAPRIQPAAIELQVEGKIAGVHIQASIDVEDVNGRLLDIRFAQSMPTLVGSHHRFRFATYDQLARGLNGKARIDTLVITFTPTTPAVASHNFTITPHDVLLTRKLYPLAEAAMQSGYYMPNRLAMNCSRRNCEFWQCCEREWSGEVAA